VAIFEVGAFRIASGHRCNEFLGHPVHYDASRRVLDPEWEIPRDPATDLVPREPGCGWTVKVPPDHHYFGIETTTRTSSPSWNAILHIYAGGVSRTPPNLWWQRHLGEAHRVANEGVDVGPHLESERQQYTVPRRSPRSLKAVATSSVGVAVAFCRDKPLGAGTASRPLQTSQLRRGQAGCTPRPKAHRTVIREMTLVRIPKHHPVDGINLEAQVPFCRAGRAQGRRLRRATSRG